MNGYTEQLCTSSLVQHSEEKQKEKLSRWKQISALSVEKIFKTKTKRKSQAR